MITHWAKARLEKLGATCSLEDIGKQTIDGKEIPLPPVLFGQLGNDKTKKTVLVYGHLDVQPAAKEDGWATEPFTLTEKDDKLFGRGASDDKGPVLCWLHAIEMLQKHKIELPINVKFCFEAMEESGSLGLEELLIKNKDKFLADVDFTCISDSYWLGTTKPCLTHGLRGICSFAVEVTGIQQDLHSGVFGGVVHEPLSDLIWVMSQLTSVENRILIPELFRPRLGHDALPWMADINDENFRAGARAMKLVHNVDPDYIREGCSIPITLTFQELTGKSVLLLPLGAADDMAHSQNEKINKVNYLQGVKTLLAYLLELGKV
ncbi:unnamed protein product [Nippostrongylus brasiliensis]|uniref:M20_dimer domain-containing protein n=1 Tax=Nippostrongylus brasiliensis TaxID=27835 RepID=A0A0N4YQQ2_NIPBR|nr:unnamed protein product [Nippostrongylus brasiliensis]